jgi:class 3 adenylate cyclase
MGTPQPVNVASRVSNLAHGREIVLTQIAYAEPGVAALAAAYPVACFESDFRGLDEKIAVCRLSLDPPATSPTPAPAKKSLRDRLRAWWNPTNPK